LGFEPIERRKKGKKERKQAWRAYSYAPRGIKEEQEEE